MVKLTANEKVRVAKRLKRLEPPAEIEPATC